MKKFILVLFFVIPSFCQYFYLPVNDYRRVDIFILPQQSDEYKQFLLEEIQNLISTHIYIEMYSFTDTDISSAVIKAIQQGCVVFLIIDPTQASTTNIDELLEQNGAYVKRKKSSTGYMHDKFMLIENSKTIWTGSANWSSSALKQDNNVLRLENFVELYNIYKNKFIELWNK